MLAVLALNMTKADLRVWYLALPAALAVTLLGASLWFLCKCAFPSLKGGTASLIYFREIAGRTEATFIDQFQKQTPEAYTRDLLGQVWRNSEILRMKFDALKIAFTLTAIAILPWLFFLIGSSILHSQLPLIR